MSPMCQELYERDILVTGRDPPVSRPTELTIYRGLETNKRKLKMQYSKCFTSIGDFKKSSRWMANINEIIWRKIKAF